MAMMIPHKSDNDAPVIAEINTTPLIDVMLVLLIMLIITIPMQTHAVKLDLAGGAAQTPPPSVSVEVMADGTIIWDRHPVAGRADLEARLRDLTVDLNVRADADAPYAQVAEVLAAAQRQNVTRVAVAGITP